MNQENETLYWKKIDGPFSDGGEYAILYFYDENGLPTTEEKAKRINAVDYDKDGNILQTNFLVKDQSNEERE